MAIAEARTRHVQALIDRLDAGGLSQRRVDAVVHALRSLFAYAQERELVGSSPAEAVALPDEEPESSATPVPATVGVEAATGPDGAADGRDAARAGHLDMPQGGHADVHPDRAHPGRRIGLSAAQPPSASSTSRHHTCSSGVAARRRRSAA